MGLQNDIQELVRAELISQDTAVRIADYYLNKDSNQSKSRLLIVFAILGAILVGLGIILILAHNWDDLSTTVKTMFAFLPMVIGQLICGFVLVKLKESVAWREGSTAFLFFAVGASISLISQIYNIPGNLSSFMLAWMLLILPLVYLMNSSITSLLYLIGITFYACETEYWTMPYHESLMYYLLLLLALPHYYTLYKNKPDSNFFTFHNWLIPLSLIITLGINANEFTELMYIAYFSLFGIFFILGNIEIFSKKNLFGNTYRLFGGLGTVVLLLFLSFDFGWEFIRNSNYDIAELLFSRELIVATILTIIATVLLVPEHKKNGLREFNPISIVFLLFIITFFIGKFSTISTPIINIIILGIGILTIRNGAKLGSLGQLNYGLLIITALVICRFFDTDLSFIVRGILFVSVGFGFFAANYWMIRNRGNK